jgi:UDP-glucose 4-epimerase
MSEPAAAGATILVVGGRGFVGSHVVRTLIASGYRVHVYGPDMAIDLLQDVRRRLNETIGSVEDTAALDAVMAAARPSAIVTCAAYGAGNAGLMRSGEADADRAFAVNVDGFRHLIDIAARHAVRRIVWTSSTVVYGPADAYGDARIDERGVKAPRTVYGLTKHLAEEVARFLAARHRIDIVGLRLPLVLGPGLWYQGAAAALIALLRAARNGEAHTIAFHDMAMDLMHVADTARAVVAALEAATIALPLYNINGFTASAGDLVRTIAVQRPGLRITHDVQPPTMRFPLICDAAFRRAFAFTPDYDLIGFVTDMLATAGGALSGEVDTGSPQKMQPMQGA